MSDGNKRYADGLTGAADADATVGGQADRRAGGREGERTAKDFLSTRIYLATVKGRRARPRGAGEDALTEAQK